MRMFVVPAVLAVMSVTNAESQELRLFEDWVVGCDNLRRCMAVGLAPADAETPAFLSVVRDGGPVDEVRLTVALADDALDVGAALILAPDDPAVPAVQAQTHDQFEGYSRARLPLEAASAVLRAVRTARMLRVSAAEPGDEPRNGAVSLAGAVAALAFMDDRQKRSGTESALVGSGPRPASALPPVPAMPAVYSRPMRELPEGAGRVPPNSVVEKAALTDACPDTPEPIAARLAGGLALWGICESAGAYNETFAFFLAEGPSARAVAFEVPATDLDHPGRLAAGDNLLTNPYVVEDGLVISAYAKGRGFGDCGTYGEWAWDGERFRLLTFSAMEACRFVPLDDWPVLYRAERR